MTKIYVVIEGDLTGLANKECATEDSILDTLSREIDGIAASYGFESYIDDITYEGGDKSER